jgi:predicted phosphodiesterase
MSNTILSLGRIDAPLLVFGGPYSNLAATLALLNQAEHLNIPSEHIICTGDIVAYCAEPEQTSQLLRDSAIHIVQGNCEESLAEGSADCGCGFEPGMVCSTLSAQWYEYANSRISPHIRAWMGALPSAITLQMGRFQCRVIHGGVEQINRFIFASTPEHEKQQELDTFNTDIMIGGHCGLPFGQKTGDRGWLNAGVIGLPANDATQSVWYMLMQPQDEGLKVSWHRLEYDFSATYASMVENGLSDYAQAVQSGLWPSMDVLPEAERGQVGHALEIESMVFR